ncbi:hypothetical protein H072_9170 [Dactylellina haptotyla CBS 200.50]|uniref:Uncharacterized protein n=1 Tax=Dactylellina haptotyla (strain CBS 200.50) TaxID=1284197 RepID=S8A369_DACHA|nr:hypothetical protein H072_9170 [Dactylellina haptotyla CBS 200.50]
MESTPPRLPSPTTTYIPRRRPFRHRPRRSLVDGDVVDGLAPANSLAALTPPRALPRARSSTATRRRSLLASSIDPDCPFSYQPPKKRKIEDYSRPQSGTKLLRLSLAYCDGGTYEGERYRIGNMLVDDDSVYCTERYSCNIVLQHETKQPFTLEWLEIKAPPHGFTSPVSEGVIAVTDENYCPVVEKIALYGRMIPLKKRVKRRNHDEDNNNDNVDEFEVEGLDLRYRYSRDGDPEIEGEDRVERAEEEDEYPEFLEGERVTEFDILSQYRRDDDDRDEEDKEDEEEVEGGGDADGPDLAAEEGGANSDGSDLLDDTQPDGAESENETITPATSTESMPWPPMGSRRLPRATSVGSVDNDGDDGTQHDCPFDIPDGEDEDIEVNGGRQETDEDSTEDELRQWLLRNSSQERRRRRRRRQEEEEAEREYAESEIDGANGEAYMRFQLRDNKTFIVFNPPRYCKHIVIKLWGSKIDNVDVQSILGYGNNEWE